MPAPGANDGLVGSFLWAEMALMALLSFFGHGSFTDSLVKLIPIPKAPPFESLTADAADTHPTNMYLFGRGNHQIAALTVRL